MSLGKSLGIVPRLKSFFLPGFCWPVDVGRFLIEDRFGITGARWSHDGAEVILKPRAVVVNGDLDDYMRYYKERYRDEHHLARYDEDTIERLNLAA